MNTSFFGELLQTITERGRALIERRHEPPGLVYSEGLAELCEQLLSIRGEGSGVALAREILARYDELKNAATGDTGKYDSRDIGTMASELARKAAMVHGRGQ